jgi:phosphopantothenoylcysteine decarboxylase/phosphopantothenate--cysteine ligase
MLTTMALATHAPVLVAPAMNPSMYGHSATQDALRALQSRGVIVVEPAVGDVACGENGQGKLASVPALVEAAMSVLQRGQWLSGQTILITGGPTHEPIDDVRFLGNRSSGKMAVALAHAATWCGASVHLVLGPSQVVVPASVHLTLVQTANDMLDACRQFVASADGIIGCAAVADYRPEERWAGKRRRSDEPWTLRLVPNPDILAELVKAKKPSAWALGFAAEPGSDPQEARQKLTRKDLDGIVFNDVSRSDIGFGADDNDVRLLMASGQEATSGVRSKLQIALWIFERLHEFGRLAH